MNILFIILFLGLVAALSIPIRKYLIWGANKNNPKPLMVLFLTVAILMSAFFKMLDVLEII
ncbi:MAG TPA: hypothetical protein VHP32_01805 [Ignavibacteria bacterium]|nr:hypothetical protein [Ignavibacteria bacterium]